MSEAQKPKEEVVDNLNKEADVAEEKATIEESTTKKKASTSKKSEEK